MGIHYDLGGEGVAYHDNDAVNWGVPFRSDEGVDIEASNDVGGGYDIGWIEDGEWVEYTIDVEADGMYTVTPMIASVPGGGSLHIEFDGQDLTGQQSVQVTGGWQFWEALEIPPLHLNAGVQVMHVAFYGGQFNLNWIQIETLSSDTDLNITQPLQLVLEPNYPNPFNPTTTIRYGLPLAAEVSLLIYDVRGQVVHMLKAGEQTAGWHEVSWSGESFTGSSLSTGIYFAQLNSGEFSHVIKMLYLR